MTTSIVFLMDDVARLNPKKDSSLAMLEAAQARGWQCFYCQQQDLVVKNENIRGYLTPIKTQHQAPGFALGEATWRDLTTVDVVMMRKDPPFDMEYIYTTYLLELLEQYGVLVVNKPSSLRDYNEKTAILHFPQCIPPTLVSRNIAEVKAFIKEQKDVVLKPLDAMGGRTVFRVSPDELNLNVILETLSVLGQRTIMAQKYLAEVSKGDRRILLIDGTAVPYALARMAPVGDFRANLAVGGSGVGKTITEREQWICNQIGPFCRQKGLLFVGLDIIGDYMTEINITSPTCIRELNAAFNLDIGSLLLTQIAKRLAELPPRKKSNK